MILGRFFLGPSLLNQRIWEDYGHEKLSGWCSGFHCRRTCERAVCEAAQRSLLGQAVQPRPDSRPQLRQIQMWGDKEGLETVGLTLGGDVVPIVKQSNVVEPFCLSTSLQMLSLAKRTGGLISELRADRLNELPSQSPSSLDPSLVAAVG